jgi:Protein of unknown function (DUF2505)
MLANIEMFTRRIAYTRFVNVFYSEAFHRAIMNAVHLKERTERERTLQPDGKERIRVYVQPRVEMPALIEKLTSGYTIGYEETIELDVAARRARVTVQNPGPLHISADIRFAEEAEGIRTFIELWVQVKILGVGAVAERFVANEIRKRYEVVETELQHYLDERRDLTAEPHSQAAAH